MSSWPVNKFVDERAVIRALAKEGSNLKQPSTDAERLSKLSVYLDELSKVTMTPDFNNKAFVKLTLESITKPNFFFRKDHVDQARQLLDKFNGENWGRSAAAAAADDNSSDGSRSPDSRARRRGSSPRTIQDRSRGGYRDRSPPASHPIWGEQGIMHGLAQRVSDKGTKTKVLSTRLRKRNADVFGNNKLQVGQWFPSQLSALFNGAHGHSQAGIHYGSGTGAYSIVISGAYEDLDQDRGETIYYSGSGSHDNDLPNSLPPRTAGTEALSISLSNQKPVRVLRSGAGKSRFAPSVGLRYDGLYRVVDALTPLNSVGGLYEQFKLERIDGQTSLEECRRVPSGSQVRDYYKINDGF
jgi:hypothetical protein